MTGVPVCPPWCSGKHGTERPARFHYTQELVSPLSCHSVETPATVAVFGSVEASEPPTVHLSWGDGEMLMFEIEEAREVVEALRTVLGQMAATR